MSNDDLQSWLMAQQMETEDEQLAAIYNEFESLYERKLWHELTDALIKAFNLPNSAPKRLEFYKVFISKFADKINQLKLVELALKAMTQCKDHQERLTFMEGVAKKVDHEDSQDAFIYATIAVAQVNLQLRDLPEARKRLDDAERRLDSFDNVETVVHAAFYEASAAYYKATADFASYYRNALLYLACIDIDADLDPRARRQRAYDLAMAALVSATTHNFGELLLHPILDALRADDAWLRELLFAFNRGDLAAYDRLAARVRQHPLLSEYARQLQQKIYLAALTEAVFRRPPHDRAMTFATIARETKVAEPEIEHLIMKALSLGLIRGTIDQVDQVAQINWVQPKVLDMKQIGGMRERLKQWDSSVNQLGNWIESAGQDVWAS